MLRWICSYAFTWEGTGIGWEEEVVTVADAGLAATPGREDGRLGLGVDGEVVVGAGIACSGVEFGVRRYVAA